jgi:hypothetical protein
MAYETYFLTVITDEGGVVTYTELPETLPEITRKATTADVYTSSRQIVEEFDRAMLSNKILQDLIPLLVPEKEPTVPDVVKEALKKRNINPER